MKSDIRRAIELIAGDGRFQKIPATLEADWENTNHFEIHNLDPNADFFFLEIRDYMNPKFHEDEEFCNLLGRLLELGCIGARLITESLEKIENEKNNPS